MCACLNVVCSSELKLQSRHACCARRIALTEMSYSLSVADLSKELRRCLARPQSDERFARALELILDLPDAMSTLEQLEAHEREAGVTPSLLMHAVASGSVEAIRALLHAGMKPRLGEDPYAAAYDVVTTSHVVDDARAADVLLCTFLSTLWSKRVRVPRSPRHAPSHATIMCAARGYALSLDLMTQADPDSCTIKMCTRTTDEVDPAIAAHAKQLCAALDAAEASPMVGAMGAPQAARDAVHALLRDLRRGRTLELVVEAVDKLMRKRSADGVVAAAVNTCDVDIVEKILHAGPVSRTYQGTNIFAGMALPRGCIVDERGARASEARIIHVLRILYDARASPRDEYACANNLAPPTNVPVSVGLFACADRVDCVRVMVDELDTADLRKDATAHAELLHAAASSLAVNVSSYLVSEGWNVNAINPTGLSPVGTCLACEPSMQMTRICSVLAVLITCADNIRRCGLCMPVSSASTMMTLHTQASNVLGRARLLFYLCAAVRTYPAGVCVVRRRGTADDAIMLATVLRECPLDETAPGTSVRLCDPLRVSGMPALAVRVAVAADTVVDVNECTHPDAVKMRVGRAWVRLIWPHATRGVSGTLRCWAWMRRLHVLRARALIVRQAASARREKKNPVEAAVAARAADAVDLRSARLAKLWLTQL